MYIIKCNIYIYRNSFIFLNKMQKKMLTKLVINIYICNKFILQFFFENYFLKNNFFSSYICILNMHSQGCSNIKLLKTTILVRMFNTWTFFHGEIMHFHLIKDFFPEDFFFVKNHTGAKKKVLNW